ncbi:CARDB domain-containing protein, partial [Nostoc sp. CHAB 5715]|uniref:CARDB domain-containing protein n=1 Tax=Nostoc sp. CHAB 5715 TaxID=2780400 RepID=UPI001E28301B
IYSNNNSQVSNAVQVTFTPPSDLVVTNVTSPTTAKSGNKIDISWTVANSGTGDATSGWVDEVFLKQVDSGGQLISLGTFRYGNGLQAGKFYTRSEQFTLPSTLQGLYEVEVKTNADNSLYESTATGNNTNSTTPNNLLVSLTPRPDLQVKSIIAPTTANAGGTISLEFIVTNQGTVGTITPNWQDKVYLSLDDKISYDDLSLGSFSNATALGTLESYRTLANTLVIPKYFRGEAYLIVATDVNAQVDEYPQESNNIKAVKLNINSLPPADLVTSQVIAPTLAFEGSKIKVRYTVTNSGIGETDRDSWTDTIWLTRDKNRTAATNVTSTPADLIVTSVKTLPQNFSGERTTVEWTVQNVGADIWSGTRYWYDEIWVSPDPTFIADRATKVGFVPYSSLSPLRTGETYTQKQDIILPAGINGEYYIYVSTDYSYDYNTRRFRGEIPNSGGDNNSYSGSFEYRVFENPTNNGSKELIGVTYREPDLQVSNLIVPEIPPTSSQTITVNWTVSNTGTRDTRENSWYDRIYLSRDESLDLNDTLLREFAHRGSLQQGQSYTQTGEITLPDGVDGDFYLLVFTDSNVGSRGRNLFVESNSTFARVPEFQDEGNNITAKPLTVGLQPPPDLQVTSVIIPERSTTGQSFNLKYTVTNKGTGDTPTRQNRWNDLIYLSRDEFLDNISDRYLGYVEHTGGLSTGSSYTINKTLQLPNDLVGSYYVFVITDAPQNNGRDIVFEGTKESNNASSSIQPLILELPPPADLQVDEISVPSNAKSGEQIQISWKVTNYGDNPASGEWSDAVYLSTDAVWDINDRIIGECPTMVT